MFVYAMRGGGYAKIGVSDNIEKRLASFNSGTLPFEMSVICLAETDTMNALQIEADILNMMPVRLRGEWIEGSVSDDDMIAAFAPWLWNGPVLVMPSAEQIAKANRASILQRQFEASKAVVMASEARMPAGVDWHRIGTELAERGDIKTLRKVKKAFRAKRLAAQHRVSK